MIRSLTQRTVRRVHKPYDLIITQKNIILYRPQHPIVLTRIKSLNFYIERDVIDSDRGTSCS